MFTTGVNALGYYKRYNCSKISTYKRGVMMNIRMYNVLFGDCFLIQEEQENLLVDFGRDDVGRDDTGGTKIQPIADDIIELSEEKDLSILLTHFHRDHVNGIYWTNLLNRKEIDRLYIPNIVALQGGQRQLSYVTLVVLSEFFDAICFQNGNPQITLYTLLLKCICNNTTVQLIERGCTFQFGGKDYDVLWPKISELSVITENVQDKITKFLKIFVK